MKARGQIADLTSRLDGVTKILEGLSTRHAAVVEAALVVCNESKPQSEAVRTLAQACGFRAEKNLGGPPGASRPPIPGEAIAATHAAKLVGIVDGELHDDTPGSPIPDDTIVGFEA